MTLVDQFLDHAAVAVRGVWAAQLPPDLLDVWWMRGDAEQTHAALDQFPDGAAAALAWYAALDRDPARASRAARTALDRADLGSLPIVLGIMPRTDPDLIARAVAACRRVFGYSDLRRMWPRVLDPDLGLPEVGDLADKPPLLAVAATRMAEPVRVVVLEQAWGMVDSGDVGCLVLATRAIGAWHVVPKHHRGVAARVVAFDGDLATLETWIAEADSERAGRDLMASAALGHPPSPAWIEPLRAYGAEALTEYEEGLVTENERATREWAALVCEGPAAVDSAILAALVAAHAAATTFAQSIGLPPRARASDGDPRRRVLAAVTAICETPKRLYSVLRSIMRVGRRGELALVRDAIDQLEQTFGPLLALDNQLGVVEALAYYPGRSADLVDHLDEYASASTRAAVVGALARDGHVELARQQAALVTSAPIGWLDREEVELIAGVVLDTHPDARARLAAFIAEALAKLPGRSLEETRAWLANPIAPAVEPVTPARSAPLEAMLVERDDAATALIYGDYLQSHGDPRGELIALHHAGKLAEAGALLARYPAHFLGPLAAYATPVDRSDGPVFTWHHGFIRAARLGFDRDQVLEPGHSLAHALDVLLAHPSGAVLRELVVTVNIVDGHSDFGPAIEAIERHGAPALRSLRLGEFSHAGPRSPRSNRNLEISWTRFADMSGVWSRLTQLESLTLQGSLATPMLAGIDLPALTSLAIISGGVAAENTRAIAGASWPNLETLELWFGSDDHGFTGGVDDILPLLAGVATPRLHTLRLMNAAFADQLVEPLAHSALLPRLRELSLALGTLSDDGAALLARHRRKFAHLDVLDLEDSCLTDAGLDLVATIAPDVRVASDKELDDGRFVSVGE